MSDEEKIRNIINDMCNKDHNLAKKHMSLDSIFIRPSGNPLNMIQWDEMMNNTGIIVNSYKLVSINKLVINGNMAYVCYTSHGEFNYQGTDNNDIAVLTNILEKRNGIWKVVHGQRSTGRKPSEPMPTFKNL